MIHLLALIFVVWVIIGLFRGRYRSHPVPYRPQEVIITIRIVHVIHGPPGGEPAEEPLLLERRVDGANVVPLRRR